MGQTRNYGIDILKLLAMFFVVILHEGSHGGLLDSTTGVQHQVAQLINFFAYCGVDCFVLITGYCQVKLQFKSKRLISLWAVAFFYSIALSLFISYYRPDLIANDSYILMFFPISSTRWWFMSAYFGLMFLSPFINKIFNTASRQQIHLLFYVLIICFSLIPFLTGTDMYALKGGYSLGWFIILYMLGACLKILNPFANKKAAPFIAYFLIVITGWLLLIYSDSAQQAFALLPNRPLAFMSYPSPFVLFSAIALVLGFSKLNIKHTFLQKNIAFAVPHNLAVYLISDFGLMRNAFISNLFTESTMETVEMIIMVLAVALGVFIACIIIDTLRSLLFSILRINTGINKIGDAIDNRLLSRDSSD